MDRNTAAQTIRIELSPEEQAPPAPAAARQSSICPPSRRMAPTEATLYLEFMRGIYDAVLITNRAGCIVDGNARAVEFFQYALPELRAQNILNLIVGFNQKLLSAVWQNLEHNRFTLIEAFGRRQDQSLFPTEIAPSPLHLGGEIHLGFFVRDITKRKKNEEDLRRTQQQLARAERLEMSSNLAGHIAHDFNNLLTPLIIYPDFIREHLPPDSPAQTDLQAIKKTAHTLAEINQQLLALARRGYHEQVPFNINEIVKEAVDLLRRLEQQSRITFNLELMDPPHNIKGTPQQLLRVIQNLCQNALDAMSLSGGTLTVRTAKVHLAAPVKHYEVIAAGDYVQLTVTDSGVGIPDEIYDRLFDPFFTTKQAAPRRGSGLGLSVVHGIVKDHHGYIDVESTPGQGTTFSLYFPVCQEAAAVAEETPLRGGQETILLIDDDSSQLDVISRLLAKLGYNALCAQGGEQALALIRECAAKQQPFPDLLILDMVMAPGLNGAQTYQHIKAINPHQKAIMLSGYEESTKVLMAQELGAGQFLRKPVTMEILARAIRAELDGAASLAPGSAAAAEGPAAHA